MNGLAAFVEKCTATGKALLLLGAMAGAGLSAGLLMDDVLGVPGLVAANTSAIAAQDTAHMEIMQRDAFVTEIFRDSILTVQSSILRTLRAWLCIEAAREAGRSITQCGLQQLLPSRQ